MLATEGVTLLAVAAVLAGWAPFPLSRARWTRRDPRLGLLAWQAVGLAGGMAIVSAELTLVAAALDRHWWAGVTGLTDHPDRLGPGGLAWLVALVATLGWLLLVLLRSSARVLTARREHRARLDLLAARDPDQRGGTLDVLDHPSATAYCVPGVRPRVVLSSGALAALGEDGTAAVIAHERAHLRARHDLVVQPFVAWRLTFPFLPAARVALHDVELLVELHADRIAAARYGPEAVARAVRALRSAGQSPRIAALGVPAQADIDERLTALRTPPRPLSRPAATLVLLAATLLVLGPPVILLGS